jgi:hypothetical protein
MANKPTVKLPTPLSGKLTPPGGLKLAAPKLTLASVMQTAKKAPAPAPLAPKLKKPKKVNAF